MTGPLASSRLQFMELYPRLFFLWGFNRLRDVLVVTVPETIISVVLSWIAFWSRWGVPLSSRGFRGFRSFYLGFWFFGHVRVLFRWSSSLFSLGLFFTGGTSLRKVVLCLWPKSWRTWRHRWFVVSSLMSPLWLSLLAPRRSLRFAVCFTGHAPTMWCGSMSMPWRPILSFPSFIKSWYSALSWTPPAWHSRNSLGRPWTFSWRAWFSSAAMLAFLVPRVRKK